MHIHAYIHMHACVCVCVCVCVCLCVCVHAANHVSGFMRVYVHTHTHTQATQNVQETQRYTTQVEILKSQKRPIICPNKPFIGPNRHVIRIEKSLQQKQRYTMQVAIQYTVGACDVEKFLYVWSPYCDRNNFIIQRSKLIYENHF